LQACLIMTGAPACRDPTRSFLSLVLPPFQPDIVRAR